MDDYELGEDEHYLDDMEDTVGEEEDSEYGVRNDDDDEANEGREDEESFRFGADTEPPETDTEDEVEDEADDIQAFMNNERRGEIATLEWAYKRLQRQNGERDQHLQSVCTAGGGLAFHAYRGGRGGCIGAAAAQGQIESRLP